MQRRGARLVVVAIATLAMLGVVAPAAAVNPHGGYTPATVNCTSCHVGHEAAGSPIIQQSSERALCLSCHDGSASQYNIVGEFAAGSASKHPADAGGPLQCGSCHTAHEGPAEGNPASIAVAGTAATTGSGVCAGCHGNGSTLAGGDIAVKISGTPHDLDGPADSLGDIGCRSCHEAHASSNDALIRDEIVVGGTTQPVTSAKRLCLTCHEASTVAYSGASIASEAKHFTVTSSSKALTTYPGGGSACTGCHEPHGKGSGPSYTRVAGRALCEQCHGAAGLTYGADYSYQGVGAFTESGHAGQLATQRFVNVGPGSDGFAAWESTVAPTPSSPGSLISDSRTAALGRLDGTRLRTSLQTVTGGHDYQLYRFKLPSASADVVEATIAWAGYGEETAGYPVAVSLWLPATGTWEQVANRVMGTQQTISAPVRAADHVTAEGYVYLLADSTFVKDGQLVSGPTFTAVSDTSYRVTWTTAGTSSSWVDYGTTSSYGFTAGSASRVTSHSVVVTGLTTGTWHFRVRSVSPEGEDYTSGDYLFALPRPSLAAPLPGNQYWDGVPLSTTFYWNALSGPNGPYEYRVQVLLSGSLVYQSVWMTSTALAWSFNAPGDYAWQVEARDASGISHGASDYASFYIYDNTGGSCPFLYTWDGDSFAFEGDMMMSGKLGNKVATGYQKPNPQDAYVLGTTPAAEDGLWKYRLVEERYEVDYLDRLQLFAADVPEGYQVYAEKPGVGGTVKEVAAQLHTVKNPTAPVHAIRTDTGADISSEIAADDEDFVVLNENREDFSYKTVELDLGDVATAPQVKLLIDGVSAFFMTPEGTANSAKFGPRTKVEVQKPDGSWYTVPQNELFMPVPPEFARTYVLDITKALAYGGPKVRLTFLYKTYIDMIKVDTSLDQPVTLTESPLRSADLRHHGLDPREVIFEDVFEHVYGPANEAGMQFPGAYTKYGSVGNLLDERDDRFVVLGGGDELALEFGVIEPPAAGMERQLVFGTYGFYKDKKTDLDSTVEPLPFSAMSSYPYPASESYPSDDAHNAYRSEWNTRVIAAPEVAAPQDPTVLQVAAGWLTSAAQTAWAKVVWTVSDVVGPPADEFPVDHRSLNTDFVALDVTVSQSVTAGGECGICHAMHGAQEAGKTLTGGRAASDGRTCTGDGAGGCHSDAANSASGVNINERFTASTDPRAHHDVRLDDQRETGSSLACADCHNPHKDNTQVRYADPDNIATTIASPLSAIVNAAGEMYVLMGADHDGTGPSISGIVDTPAGDPTTATITWTTNEPASTWIDWGLTASYEIGSMGSDALVTSHSAQLTGLVYGTTYHYRVRSADALGNVTTSLDRTYRPTAPPAVPTPADETTFTGTGWGPIELNALDSSSVASSDGHAVQYQFLVDGTSASGWLNVPTWVTPTWFYDGGHTFQVRARDAVETYAVSAWSAADAFSVTGAADPGSGSCPFLFTWDGTGYRFEADMLMSGKLGNKIATGYQKPNPQDAYTLSTIPREVDGSWRFRLVEERFETDYIDQVQLFAADAPAGYTVLAEKPGVGGTLKQVAAQLHTVRDPVTPRSAVRTDTGEDISAKIENDDEEFVVLNDDRNNFEYKTVELDLGDVSAATQVKLVIDGVSAFFQSREGTARSAQFGPRTKVEVQKLDGSWFTVPSSEVFMPVPPEFARTYVFDITKALAYGGTKVRLTFLYKTYIDMIRVDTSTDQPIVLTEAKLNSADLRHHGLDDASTVFEDVYDYVYGEGNAVEGFFEGNFTKYAEVSPLLAEKDDEFVIMGGGDELQLDFEPLGAPADGVDRSLVFASYGFYKDRKNDLPQTVEPLPFSGMSNYPYTNAERYPDDFEHDQYRAAWNTRAEGTSMAAAAANDAPVWHVFHTAAWTSPTEDSFSVDTDYLSVRLDNVDRTVSNLSAVAGWETTSTAAAPPTPSAPGTAVSAARLASASTDDGVNWRTNLAIADRVWNWQVGKFSLGAGVERSARSMLLTWNGHGEPTPGYNTAVYVWNFSTSSWVLIRRADMASDQSAIASEQAVAEAFCFRCHDGSPPAGVTFPSGAANVGVSWAFTDFHGGGTGAGFGTGGLKQPYQRGQASIPCSTCHETHGSESLYHFPSAVNGTALAPIASGPAVLSACGSCHAGNANQWHQQCVDCHNDPWGHSTAGLDFTSGYDCVACHKHATRWTHPDGCHCGPGGQSWKTF